jgi:acyl dehydratase
MEVSSRFVDASLKPLTTQITWRQTTNYAAAVGDLNPRYLDDERTEGIVAPPMFPVAVTWPISERVWEYIAIPDFPYEILLTQVHYTEHIRLYRLLRPEDKLLIKGRIAAIVPHKSGTLMVLRYDAYDQTEGLVFTEHIGGLMRGVQCPDGGLGAEELPKMPSLETKGPPVWEASIPVSTEAPFIYDGCTNIIFPIHTSVRFAHQVGLPGIIYQGTAVLALGVREVTNREIGGDPVRVKAISCRFTGMVIPGSTIQVQMLGRSTEKDQTDIFFEILNSEGKRAVSNGVVSVSL